MSGAKVRSEFGLSVDDLTPTRRPPGQQVRVQPDDLTDTSLGSTEVATGSRAVGEPDPERAGQVMLEPGVVRLGRGDDGLEQHTTVDREPPTRYPASWSVVFDGLDLVPNRDMGMQVGVTGP